MYAKQKLMHHNLNAKSAYDWGVHYLLFITVSDGCGLWLGICEYCIKVRLAATEQGLEKNEMFFLTCLIYVNMLYPSFVLFVVYLVLSR